MTYYVIRQIWTPGQTGFEQQTWHPTRRQWLARNEADGFARRYTSEAAAKRAARRVGADGVALHQQYSPFWRVAPNGELTDRRRRRALAANPVSDKSSASATEARGGGSCGAFC